MRQHYRPASQMLRPHRLIRRCRRLHGRGRWGKRLPGLCRIAYMHLEKLSLSLAGHLCSVDSIEPYRYGRRQCSKLLSGLHVLLVVKLRRLRRKGPCRLPRPRRPIVSLINWRTTLTVWRTGYPHTLQVIVCADKKFRLEQHVSGKNGLTDFSYCVARHCR